MEEIIQKKIISYCRTRIQDLPPMSDETQNTEGIDLVLISVDALDSEDPSRAWTPMPLVSAHWTTFTINQLIEMPQDMFDMTVEQFRRDTQNGESNASLQAYIEQASQQYQSDELADEDPGEDPGDGSTSRYEPIKAKVPRCVQALRDINHTSRFPYAVW
ncbi:hypothetical protein L202_03280 [Cryptococcus amylolentus CBS 6039]|uniref:Uncharacterized protein n=2 Tax=Cryptococcus amylolentus TaxID=104669 RepID=A0A1E3HU73_9TREE|nr:hypothetical protein L202_03280 [Cryptococcus amylolentus CBS 6039]ODN79266.1 hypothetical protein L202_03280 [Cryptococcus amylolentus CBS 6039]ODO07672.1 hypothetical protein I350_03243 [Cryptococcus amylolentus CBS 6273]